MGHRWPKGSPSWTAAGSAPFPALSRRAAGQREGRPVARNALELPSAPVVKVEVPSGDRPRYRARHQDLARFGKAADTRSDVDGHSADVLADHLALAGVHADSNSDTEIRRRGHDRAGATQRRRRGSGERGEKTVAGGLDLAPTEAGKLLAHRLVVFSKQIAPRPIPQLRGP